MRRLYVGTNDFPMQVMLSPATMPNKPALLS